MASIKNQMHPIPFMEGSRFLVVDAGGGTIDITAHEVRCIEISNFKLTS